MLEQDPPASLPLADQDCSSPETFTVFEMSNPAGSYRAGVRDEDFAGLLQVCPCFGSGCLLVPQGRVGDAG